MIFRFYLFTWEDKMSVPRGTSTKPIQKSVNNKQVANTKFPEESILTCKDYTVSGNKYELRPDPEKEMLVTFPRPKPEELSNFYKSEKYISHTDSSASLFDKAYQWVKSYMADKKLHWLEMEFPDRGVLLDIGAGTGDFLVRAKRKGWEVSGVEPSQVARKLASKKGVVLEESTTTFPKTSFDVITMWHVLEHVPDLEEQIGELKRLLKEDGLLVVAVPNFKSYDAQKYREHWAAYDVPRHLWHFSQTTIEKLFSAQGFKVEKSKGLIFDAYYVSLLSEKYLNSRFPLKGLFTGFLSNLRARRTSEYSSLAYFIKKK